MLSSATIARPYARPMIGKATVLTHSTATANADVNACRILSTTSGSLPAPVPNRLVEDALVTEREYERRFAAAACGVPEGDARRQPLPQLARITLMGTHRFAKKRRLQHEIGRASCRE